MLWVRGFGVTQAVGWYEQTDVLHGSERTCTHVIMAELKTEPKDDWQRRRDERRTSAAKPRIGNYFRVSFFFYARYNFHGSWRLFFFCWFEEGRGVWILILIINVENRWCVCGYFVIVTSCRANAWSHDQNKCLPRTALNTVAPSRTSYLWYSHCAPQVEAGNTAEHSVRVI